MPIDCVWMGEYKELPATPYEPGWMFFHGPWAGRTHLSDVFLARAANERPPICVILPVASHPGYGTGFCIDAHYTDRHDGWAVEVDLASLIVGQRPLITVAPSINCVCIYHGYLQDGILADDLGS